METEIFLVQYMEKSFHTFREIERYATYLCEIDVQARQVIDDTQTTF